LKTTDKERKENKKRSGTRSNNIRDGNMGRGIKDWHRNTAKRIWRGTSTWRGRGTCE